MNTEATTISRSIRQPRIRTRATISKPNILERYRHVIESTDWDKELLQQEKWIDRICLGLIILSVLYFLPVMLFSLL